MTTPAVQLADLIAPSTAAIARGSVGDGRGSAIALLAAAVRAEPQDRGLQERLRRAVSGYVPRWHFGMMNDLPRNAAYRQAVEDAVRPGDLVLDIGSGAGLTALMAARAGASRVVSCEANPVTAALAREVVAVNGYADRITVLSKPSTALVIGEDLPRRPDVLITEIFDCALIGESALPTLNHAVQQLVREDTRMVPTNGRMWAQLVDSPELETLNRVDLVDGFDLSTFNLAASHDYFCTQVGRYAYEALSAPFPLFDFDFHTAHRPDEVELKVPIVRNGACQAVVLWFDLDLGNGTRLANPPGVESHWPQGLMTMPKPVPVKDSGAVWVNAAHDLVRLQLHLSVR